MKPDGTISLAACSGVLACSACLCLLTFTDARADNDLLGLYAGAGVGYANLNDRFAYAPAGGPMSFPSNWTSWKLLVGIRPLSWLGSELEYIDSGSDIGPRTPVAGLPDQFYGANSQVRAGTLFAVGYLPLPSWIDVFGKVGISHAWTSASFAGNFPNTYVCAQPPTCVPLGQVSVSESDHSTGFAYGGGIQFNYSQLSARLDFEGMSWKKTGGPYLYMASNPYFASFVVTWKLRPR